MAEERLEDVFNSVIGSDPSVMRAFIRGFTLSNDYDEVFDALTDEEE